MKKIVGRSFVAVALTALALAALIGEMGAPAWAQQLFSNNLFVNGANSGSTPAIQAVGTDTNISINLIPKGTGTVQVNGAVIAASGGTVASLTINPGPLNVTGTTNHTGPLFIQPGTAATLKLVGARIFHNVTDSPTVGTALETIMTDVVEANTLAVNGQSLRVTYWATTTANANNKTLLLTYGATTIVTVGPGAFNNSFWYVTCDIYRTGAATQKALCTTTQGTTNANSTPATQTFLTTPAETLSGAVSILARATTPTAAGDVIARALTTDWYPVGQ
jgi:hypothetical protein